MNQNDYVLYSGAVNHFFSLERTDRISHLEELAEKGLSPCKVELKLH